MQWPFKTTVKFEGRDGHIVAATGKEAAQLNLPDGCVQLLG